MTQNDQISLILERDGKIDNFTCIHNRISLRLGARIYDLRKRGYEIESKESADGNCTYTLKRSPNEVQRSHKVESVGAIINNVLPCF